MGIYGLDFCWKRLFDNLLGEQVRTRWLTTGCFNRIARLRSCLTLDNLYIYIQFVSKHQDNKDFIQEYMQLGRRGLRRSRSHPRLLEDYWFSIRTGRWWMGDMCVQCTYIRPTPQDPQKASGGSWLFDDLGEHDMFTVVNTWYIQCPKVKFQWAVLTIYILFD